MQHKYLLDTSTCIEFLRGNPITVKQMYDNDIFCCISTITEAELFNGVYHAPERYFLKELHTVQTFVQRYETFSLLNATEFYSKEKKRLETLGTPVDDFDLMIGAIGVKNNLIIVTSNTKHFENIEGIQLVDWSR